MKQVNVDAKTNEITIVDVPDIPIVPTDNIDYDAELSAAISAATTIAGLKDALLGNSTPHGSKAKARVK